MKIFTRTLLLSFIFLLGSNNLKAQETLFGDIFNQLGFEEQTEFLNNYDINVDSAYLTNPGDFPFNFDSLFLDMGILDSLSANLDDLPVLDDDYLDALGLLSDTMGLDSIFEDFGQLDLDTLAGDSIVAEIGNINDLFNINFDSLGNLGDQYGDTLDIDINEPNQNGLNETNLEILQDSLFNSIDNSDNNEDDFGFNIGIADQILDQIFDSNIFPSLELAFGVQDNSAMYYGREYATIAKVIRLGSVPSFNQMWEPRWHVKGSVIGEEIENYVVDESNNSTNNASGVVPLLYDGDFALMINPTLGSPNVRLITSFGMEVGTYVPAHEDFNAFTQGNNNCGFTTGIGAQIGSGFSVKTGDLTVYTLATLAYGDVVDRQRDAAYRYNSLRFSAGVRFGDIINVRYSTGQQTWAQGDEGNRKQVNTNHQLTLGVILQELNRP